MRPQVLKATLPLGEIRMEPGLITLHRLPGPGEFKTVSNSRGIFGG